MHSHDANRRGVSLLSLVVILGALVSAGCYDGLEDTTPPPMDGGEPLPATVSFVADVQPIFTQNCAIAGCHDATTSALGLNLEAGVAFDNIVAVPSQEVPTQPYITPGDPDNSYLFRKIAGAPGIVGSRMPLTNFTFFEENPELLERIRLWILEGAMPTQAASQ